jgi:GNAT superfamily N-acetyltransferase
MSIVTSISRLATYCARNGFRATARRAALAVRRALFANHMILFYCDLSGHSSWSTGLPSSLNLERKRKESEVSPQDLQAMINFWNSKLALRNMKERFAQGASLWMIKSEGTLAGFGWTLQARTIEPHYFRLGQEDVHLFDFHVFPEYRGQGLNPLLVTQILSNLAAECDGRAFIEAAEWNHAQLASLRKTPFLQLGWARKLTMFRNTMVLWDENKAARQNENDELKIASKRATGPEPSGIAEL